MSIFMNHTFKSYFILVFASDWPESVYYKRVYYNSSSGISTGIIQPLIPLILIITKSWDCAKDLLKIID